MKNFLLNVMATVSLAMFTVAPMMAAPVDASCGTGDLSVNISDVVSGELTLTFTGTGIFTYSTSQDERDLPWAGAAAQTSVKSIKIVWGANVEDASFVFYTIASKVKTIEVTEGVTALPFGFCGGMTKLSTVAFSSTVSDIDNDFFSNSALDSISVADGNATYSTPNGCNTLIHNASHTIIRGCSKSVIPTGVTTVGEGAFASITSLPDTLILTSGIVSVEKDAFKNCTGLKTIELPDALTTIGDYAFNGCTKVPVIDLPISVDNIGAHAFDISNSKLVINVSAETPATIGTSAFKGSYKLMTENCALLPAYRSAWESYEKRIIGAYPYEVTVVSADELAGSVELLQAPDCDKPAVVKATAFNGYTFSRWTIDGKKVGNDIVLDSIMLSDISADVEIVAEFKQLTALGDLRIEEPVVTDGLHVSVVCAKAGQVALIDLTGRMIQAVEASAGATVAFEAPETGVYVLRTSSNVTKLILQ